MANRSQHCTQEIFFSAPEARVNSLPGLSGNDRKKLNRLIRVAIDGGHQNKARRLRLSVHHFSIQTELMKYENKGVREALQHKQKQKKKSKALNLQQRQEYPGGAVLWPPRKLSSARAREAVRSRDETAGRQKKKQKLGSYNKQLGCTSKG